MRWLALAIIVQLVADRLLKRMRRNERAAATAVSPCVASLDLRKELEEFVDPKSVVAHHLVLGPTATYGTTILDVFLLTDKILYNCQINSGGVGWHLLPLAMVATIQQDLAAGGDDRVSVAFHGVGNRGLVIEDAAQNRGRLLQFYGFVRDRILGAPTPQDHPFDLEVFHKELEIAALHLESRVSLR